MERELGIPRIGHGLDITPLEEFWLFQFMNNDIPPYLTLIYVLRYCDCLCDVPISKLKLSNKSQNWLYPRDK
jgi:hypothetical protein